MSWGPGQYLDYIIKATKTKLTAKQKLRRWYYIKDKVNVEKDQFFEDLDR